MHVVIFEGSHWLDFVPLSLTRPVFCLRSGATTLLEKQLRYLQPTRLTLWVRPEMVDFVRRDVVPTLSIPVAINEPLHGEPVLILSGRTLHLTQFDLPSTPCVVLEMPHRLVRFAYTRAPGLSHSDVLNRTSAWLALADLPEALPQTRFARHWADLVSWNDESLASDAATWTQPPPKGINLTLINESKIHAGEGVEVGPNVVLDARKGPITLGSRAIVGAGAVLEGPCHVGADARVTPLSLIRGGTSIGPMCRVGGEVSNTIFHANSNKSHEGFVGDSYIGEWVNLGAGTTTSNLKSTYGLIKLQLGDRDVPTDRLLLGVGVGDHAKTATHTQFSAGGYVGVAALVALSQRAPRRVPSFSFWTDDTREAVPLDKATLIAQRVLPRRGQSVDDCDTARLAYARDAAEKIGA
ncbi:MAG TPA: putative sugar nucleotidyl transferase [Tepidisphaeraceae bacterium]